MMPQPQCFRGLSRQAARCSCVVGSWGTALQIQLSELECSLSNKRTRIHELEEQVKMHDRALLREQELAAQLRRQIEELKHTRDSTSKEREDRRLSVFVVRPSAACILRLCKIPFARALPQTPESLGLCGALCAAVRLQGWTRLLARGHSRASLLTALKHRGCAKSTRREWTSKGRRTCWSRRSSADRTHRLSRF